MEKRRIKDFLYEQVARVSKALSSPKRLELVEVLVQGERTVDELAHEVDIDVKLASAHLKVLKGAHLVESRRVGRCIGYRLSGADVGTLWVHLHSVAAEHLMDLRVALEKIASGPEQRSPETRVGLLDKAKRGEVLVLDVRPEAEYLAAHLPYARSIPIQELERRLAELPRDQEIVAYCRGPFCLFASEATALLHKAGFRASKLSDGVAEWSAAGLPLDASPAPRRRDRCMG